MTQDRPVECCKERLSNYLDGKDDSPEELEEHLESCASCREYLTQLASISEALGDLPEPNVSDAFTVGVMEQVKHEIRRTEFSARLSSRRVLFPLAAAMLILVGGGLFLSFNSSLRNADSIATISVVSSEEVLLAELAKRIEIDREDVPEWLFALGSEEDDDPQEALTAEEWLDTLGETAWFREMLDDWHDSSAGDYDQPEVFEDIDLLDNVEADDDEDEVWL